MPEVNSRRVAWLSALCVVMALMFGSAGVASAHSKLESSVPDNGAKVDAGPAKVSLTFNEALQESFAVLTVVGPDDHYWQNGDPVIKGATISVALRTLGPAGTYKVNYRVTSADGHPVEGQRTFELTAAGTGTPGAAVTDEQPESSGIPLWPFIVGAIVILGGGLAFVLRPRRKA